MVIYQVGLWDVTELSCKVESETSCGWNWITLSAWCEKQGQFNSYVVPFHSRIRQASSLASPFSLLDSGIPVLTIPARLLISEASRAASPVVTAGLTAFDHRSADRTRILWWFPLRACVYVGTLRSGHECADLGHQGRCTGMQSLKGAEVMSGLSSLTCVLAPGMHVHVHEMTQTVQDSSTVSPLYISEFWLDTNL